MELNASAELCVTGNCVCLIIHVREWLRQGRTREHLWRRSIILLAFDLSALTRKLGAAFACGGASLALLVPVLFLRGLLIGRHFLRLRLGLVFIGLLTFLCLGL